MTDRDRDLDQIRATYDRYRREGRRHLWDVSNPGYARMAADRDGAMVDLLQRSLPPDGGRVLDIGCGDGRLTSVARDAGILVTQWIGADLDGTSIAEASRAYPWASFVEASADRLPFDPAAFDAVVASTLFSSLPSSGLERSVAEEVARVLAPTGWLVWYDLRYDNPRNPDVHGMTAEALDRLFPAWHRELRSMTVAPPLARRLGRLTAAAYPVLEMIPLLRSHLVGRLQRPTSA